MKYQVSSFNTKTTLAASLKKLMRQKPLSKITVNDIVSDCGLNRNTFYYHFEDIYALLKWMLELETVEVLRQVDLLIDYEEAILYMMHYIEENNDILNNIYHSLGYGDLRRFFAADCRSIMRSIIDRAEAMQHLSVSPRLKGFLCDFFTEATAGTLLEWVVHYQSADDPKRLVEYVSLIFRSAITNILADAQAAGLTEP
ncbi:MAG: TetR/AcrR family transcriptional regulator C-terminal domain-containing protein [Clostridia bacterium]|nr:TetR/AcrR family transcriptional regulator C-terminal domain-containing protein [Clostridia bacterium]